MAVAEYSMRPAILRMLTASTPSLANISRAVARIFSRRLSFSRCLRCAEPTHPPNGAHLLNGVKSTDAVVMRQAKGGFGRRLRGSMGPPPFEPASSGVPHDDGEHGWRGDEHRARRTRRRGLRPFRRAAGVPRDRRGRRGVPGERERAPRLEAAKIAAVGR